MRVHLSRHEFYIQGGGLSRAFSNASGDVEFRDHSSRCSTDIGAGEYCRTDTENGISMYFSFLHERDNSIKNSNVSAADVLLNPLVLTVGRISTEIECRVFDLKSWQNNAVFYNSSWTPGIVWQSISIPGIQCLSICTTGFRLQRLQMPVVHLDSI